MPCIEFSEAADSAKASPMPAPTGDISANVATYRTLRQGFTPEKIAYYNRITKIIQYILPEATNCIPTQKAMTAVNATRNTS